MNAPGTACGARGSTLSDPACKQETKMAAALTFTVVSLGKLPIIDPTE